MQCTCEVQSAVPHTLIGNNCTAWILSLLLSTHVHMRSWGRREWWSKSRCGANRWTCRVPDWVGRLAPCVVMPACCRNHHVQGNLEIADVTCTACGEVLGCKVLRLLPGTALSCLAAQNSLRIGRFAIFKMATARPNP